MSRTDQEILARMEQIKEQDWLGTQQKDLVSRLSYEAAKPFLKDQVTADQWEPESQDPEATKKEMLDYMPFAWGKANECRGISAGRSIDHMSAWLWLLGRDDAAWQIQEYEYYGKPQLRAICEEFGWDWRQWDDGRWANDEIEDGVPVPESVSALP